MNAPRTCVALDAIYRAAPEVIATIRAQCARIARSSGADEGSVAQIKLAVTEAVTNVVRHAYGPGPGSGAIYVRVERAEGMLRVRVRDDGVGMSARTDSPGAGLGLRILASAADCCVITSSADDGTDVVLRFRLGPPATLPRDQCDLRRDCMRAPASPDAAH